MWRIAGLAAGPGPVRCDQHLSTLLILADEDLAGTLRRGRLVPLARLRPGQRDRIADTLLAWLQSGENAAEVAQRIHVHPQTVRYRQRQIQELFGDQSRDPDRRFELQLALRIRMLTASREPGRDTSPRSALSDPPPVTHAAHHAARPGGSGPSVAIIRRRAYRTARMRRRRWRRE